MQLDDIGIESVTATDDHTVVFRLKEPNFAAERTILYHYTSNIMPPEVIEEHGDLLDWRNLVGTGPYELVDWVEGSSLSYTKNPNYWAFDEKYPDNRLPYIDEIVWLSDLIGTRTLPLMAGDLDGEMRGFVERWRVAGARLAALRRSELRDVEVADHIDALDGAFEATLAGPVRTTSGLVQQQAMFARIRDARPLSPGE